MADKDPFAKYGGAALASSDPFAKYGGAAIANAGSAPAGPTQAHWGSSLGDVIDTVGSHAANLVTGPINAVMHPYNTFVQPTVTAGSRAISQAQQGHYSDAARSAESAIPIVGPWADQIENDVQNKGAVAGLAGLATDVLGPKGVGKVAGVLPAVAERAAPGIINKTIGATSKADFARRTNPGRGYLDANLGVSGSMQSIADKAAEARDSVGQQIGNAYSNATKSGKLISADDVRQAVHPILDQAREDASAPLVDGDPAVYDRLKSSLEPKLQDADAKGGFTPSELWDIRHKLDKSLNWKDQTKASLTQTQQQVSGALGGLLKDNVPEVSDLNQNYADLVKLANRSAQRAATGTSSLGGAISKGVASGVGATVGHAVGPGLGMFGGMLGAAGGAAVESIPSKTALASGLNATGKLLRPAANAASAAALPTTLAAVAGDDNPEGPSSSTSEETSDPSQASPSTESIAPEHTPDTHTFSSSEWLKSNPGGDPDEAKQQATDAGYTVTD